MVENTNLENAGADTEQITLTQDELNALVQSETDKRVTQAMKTAEKKKAKEIEQAKKLAGLSAQEQYELQLKEKEELLLERENKLTMLENKNATIDILSDKNIPIEFADIINDLDADIINYRIKSLEKAWSTALENAVRNAIPTTTPSGSKTNDSVGISKEQFKKMTIKEQQDLYSTNPELYSLLTN